MNDILIWAAAVIAIEAAVEIETESEIFIIMRDKLTQAKILGWYLNTLLSCGYCLSVWVCVVAALFVPGDIITANNQLGQIFAKIGLADSVFQAILFGSANYIVKILVLHRLSNITHEPINRWLNKDPFIIAFGGTNEEGGAATESGYQERNRTEKDAAEIPARSGIAGEKDVA